jgi:hypothetical protein
MNVEVERMGVGGGAKPSWPGSRNHGGGVIYRG